MNLTDSRQPQQLALVIQILALAPTTRPNIPLPQAIAGIQNAGLSAVRARRRSWSYFGMHENEVLIRDMYAAMARHDGRHLAPSLTEQSRWVICGHGPLAGTYTGANEIFGLWKLIAEQDRWWTSTRRQRCPGQR